MNSVEKIASSNGSTFFITNNNDVFVIGNNNYGECGTGNRESVRDISKIEEIPKAIDIKVRISRSFLLSKDFDVYSCGMNFKDSLLNESSLRFKKVEGLPKIKKIILINDDSIFLTTDGKLLIKKISKKMIEIDLDLEIVDIAASNTEILGITSDSNTYLIRYQNEINISLISTKEDFEALKVTSGLDHFLILDKIGKVHTFGDSSFGQLGIEKQHLRILPEEILNIPKIRDISAGSNSSFLISQNDEIFVFGKNTRGILGINSNEKQIRLPRKINGFKNIKNVYCSNDNIESAFFLTKLGNVYISGDYNVFSELVFSQNKDFPNLKKLILCV